jgi:hypothetical protein
MSEKKNTKKTKSNESNENCSKVVATEDITDEVVSTKEGASKEGASKECASKEDATTVEELKVDITTDEGAPRSDSTEPISIDFLRNLTSSAKEKNSNKFNEELNIAMEDAVKDITNGCFEKMKTAAANSYSRCNLKEFRWCDDKNAVFDSHGSQISFGKFKMKDFIDPRRGKDKFMPLLNNFFNKDLKETDNKYHCGYRKDTDETTGKDVWSIYVSWEKYIPRNDESSSFAKGGRSVQGFGGRGGRGVQNMGGRGGRNNQVMGGRGPNSGRGRGPNHSHDEGV